jgi:RNA polymerase sigma-70 factor (ECF subfamily)
MTDSSSSRRAINVAFSAVREASPNAAEDADARFRAIFETGFDYVWNTLRRLGVAPADLEDVSHDVLFAVYRKLDSYDPARPLRPWLFAFSYRAGSEYCRRRRMRREVVELGEVIDAGPLVDERLVDQESRALVAAALASLDLDRRAVFVMHDLDDISIPEIARCLDIPLNTAYSRLRVARERFVKALARLRLQESK